MSGENTEGRGMDGFEAMIFGRAADLIESGWVKGRSAAFEGGSVSFESPNATCFCMVGAVARALHDAGWWCQETHSAAVTALLKRTGYGPQMWNDRPERTKEEVVALLRDMARASA